MEHRTAEGFLGEVEGAVRQFLPGALTIVQNGVLAFRVGPRTGIELVAAGVGWSVRSFAEQSGPVPVDGFVLAGDPAATPADVANAFVGWLRGYASVLPATEVDAGLTAALSATAPAAEPRRHRAEPPADAPAPTALQPAIPPLSAAPLSAPPLPTPASIAPAPAPYPATMAFPPPPTPYAAYALQPQAFAAPPPISFARRMITITAVVVSALVVLGAAGGGIAALLRYTDQGSSSSSAEAKGTASVSTLAAGDCFDQADAYDAGDQVAPESCTAQHDSELMGTVAVPSTASSDASGRVAYDLADAACFALFDPYVGNSYQRSDYDYGLFAPSDDQWNSGARTAYCFVVIDDGRRSSVKGSGD